MNEALSPLIGLPTEILQQIFALLGPSSQPTLHAASLVSRNWYTASIEYLYDSPVINGKNFDAFIRSACPSVNAHIRHNGLADLIRRLDMSGLVHNGSKSLTARLLGRVKGRLEEFVAPQASFAVNSLAALSKCHRLRYLDLSLVSEAIPMFDLFRSIGFLLALETLYLPRASSRQSQKRLHGSVNWPTGLREIHVSGGISDQYMMHMCGLPTSVTHLWIENCFCLTMYSIAPVLKHLAAQLQYLKIGGTMRGLGSEYGIGPLKPTYLDNMLHLVYLSVSVDLLAFRFFLCLPEESLRGFPALQTLEIGFPDSFAAAGFAVSASEIFLAVTEGSLPKLRKLRVHRALGWTDATEEDGGVEELDDLLKALSREDGEGTKVTEAEAGVVFFGRR